MSDKTLHGNRNIMCVDLEDWYHQNLLEMPQNPERRITQNTAKLLDMFAKTDTVATFFVVGRVAEEQPELVRSVRDAGHEIACHSHTHGIIYEQSPEKFEADLRLGISAIEAACGVVPKGFRAPSWSITRKSRWALDIIKKVGFSYDSSIFPVKNFLYGIPDAPRFPYTIDTAFGSLQEIPPSTFKLPLVGNMGFSGGFYMRALPAAVISCLTRRINRLGQPAIFYLHPHEIDPGTPNLAVSLRDRIITGLGRKGCESKLFTLLKRYNFTSIADYYNV